jgi:DNA polymerase III subunit gamma/tau
MSYTVLARKYRPQTFADLVGQEHVSRTIGNAIASGRVAHAFLFTGARGVGKTTTARLLAKALCCEKGPTAEPCNACDACQEITVGTDIDVLEIDGASNNSVDDVRRLQETLPFRPARDRFKVVIVDEVHMLSTGAFNAFLKTLEEPPAHVKFIFATTEVHKVPVTIRSRCQRYDFRLIPHAVVSARVREILQREGLRADDAAVAIVAREAAGSMRDALTVLDQLLALGHDPERGLEGEAVARGLSIASRKHVFATTQALLTGDAAGCLRNVQAIGEQGLDVLHFARQLLELARDLVVLRVLGDDDASRELVDLVDDERAQASRLAGAHSKPELERAFAALGKLVEDVGRSGTPQVTLEMGLVRAADRPPLLELRELLERLQALEARLGAGGLTAGGAGGAGGSSGPSGASGGGDRRFIAPSSAGSAAKPIPRMEAPEREPTPARLERKVTAPAFTAPPSAAVAPVATTPSSSSNGHAGAPGSWFDIVAQLKASQPALGAVLEHGVPLEVSAGALRIGFPQNSFFGRQAQSAGAREAILKTAELVLGARPELSFSGVAAGDTKIATIAELEEGEKQARTAEKVAAALKHPRVRDAMEVFGETEDGLKVQVDQDA